MIREDLHHPFVETVQVADPHRLFTVLQHNLLHAGRHLQPLPYLDGDHRGQRSQYSNVFLYCREIRPPLSSGLGSHWNVHLRVHHRHRGRVRRWFGNRQLRVDCICLHIRLFLCVNMGETILTSLSSNSSY